MNATSSPAQPTPSVNPAIPTIAQIDASCRIPVMLLFVSAALWLVAGSILGLIGSLNFHAPVMFKNSVALSYGRIHPVAINCFLYGFAMPAGLAVMLWIICRLGRAKLECFPLIILGWLLWNLGLMVGILGIFGGDNTGNEWLELPRYSSIPILVGYLSIGLAAMLTFHKRADRALEIPQWFILAALFWFPWIYATAILLTEISPGRGVLQAIVSGWYAHNLSNVWFAFVGLATLFYLVPILARRPLHSRYSALFVFWALILFGSWGGMAAGAPVPSWIPALGAAGGLITIAPKLAAFSSIFRTLAGAECDSKTQAVPLFIAFAPLPFLVAGVAAGISGLTSVSAVTNLTWYVPAQQQLWLYGFFAITIFGAMHHIIPQLLGTELPSQKLGRLQFIASAVGLLIYVLFLAFAGISQGRSLGNPAVPFEDVMTSNLTFLRISTLGELFMILGNVLLLINLLRLLYSVGRTSFDTAMAANVKPLGATT